MSLVNKMSLLASRQIMARSRANLCLFRMYSGSRINHDEEGKPNYYEGRHEFSYRKHNDDPRFDGDKPTLEYAKSMPGTFSGMRHEQILQLCVEGSFQARREALIRNVMSVDDINHEEAEAVVDEIAKERRRYFAAEYAPYYLGMGTAAVSSVVSFPLIFGRESVLWFNEKFVTTDVPEAADLETFLEVGSFSWGWMEPIIGQVSFVLLVLQFARAQAVKLGIKPYGDSIIAMRSKRIVKKYPQYDPMFLEWFAEAETPYADTN